MEIKGIALTDTGLKRKVNEDNYGYFPELGLFVVADGMGGHAAGQIASYMTVAKIKEFFDLHKEISGEARTEEAGLNPPAIRLKRAIEYAGHSIYSAGRQDAKVRGMGSTVVSLLVEQNMAHIAHMGDSRLYRLRGQELQQLTQDHSLVNKLIQEGELTPEQAKHFPYRNVVTRALGTSEVLVDVRQQPLENGDTFLLCSDGLHGLVEDERLKELMALPAEEFESAGRSLIAEVNKLGGPDNITLVMVKVNQPCNAR